MAGKRKPGRRNRSPDKLTPEVQKVIVDSIAAGVPQKQAAERANITEWTIQEWKRRGRKDRSGVYFNFFNAIKKAEADRLAASVARIGKAAQGGQVIDRVITTTTKADGTTVTKTVEKVAQGQWTADAWFLERRHPESFALNHRREIELAAEKAVEKAIKNGTLRRVDEPGDSEGDTQEPKPVIDPKSV